LTRRPALQRFAPSADCSAAAAPRVLPADRSACRTSSFAPASDCSDSDAWCFRLFRLALPGSLPSNRICSGFVHLASSADRSAFEAWHVVQVCGLRRTHTRCALVPCMDCSVLGTSSSAPSQIAPWPTLDVQLTAQIALPCSLRAQETLGLLRLPLLRVSFRNLCTPLPAYSDCRNLSLRPASKLLSMRHLAHRLTCRLLYKLS